MAQASTGRDPNPIRNGLRAGLAAGLLLTATTLFAFDAVRHAVFAGAFSDALRTIGTTIGLVGAPQVVYGLVVGLVVRAWRRSVTPEFREWVATGPGDRRVASLLVVAPAAAIAVGSGVALVHLRITSQFERSSFQALGLGLATVALFAVAVAIAPVLQRGLERPLRALQLHPDERSAHRIPILTRTLLKFYGLVAVVSAIGAYRLAGGFRIWSTGTLRTCAAALVAVPVFTALLERYQLPVRRSLTRAELFAAVAILGCLPLSFVWSNASPGLRQALVGESGLLAQTAAALRPLADHDRDGYADTLGRVDCDDRAPEVHPGAPEIPGNGRDEDCSGADATPPSATGTPARSHVRRALERARRRARGRAGDMPEPPKNIVLMLVDTVRYDHLGFAGYERDTSPSMDRVAADAAVFERAYAPSPHTPRSIPPLFFGRYPRHIEWRGPTWNYPEIRDENLSLFEVLAEQGWTNIGVSSHHYFEPDQGIRQGFERWTNEGAKSLSGSNEDVAAPRIWENLEPILERLGERGGDRPPFSLFVHLFEPHAEWIEHEDYEFGDAPTTRGEYINRYDSEIAFTDAYVGKIVDKLRAVGLWNDVVFVIVSDHGEAFQEHGHYFHGQTLYNEVLHVPLVIRIPGWNPTRIETPVSLVDVAPTLLELVDVPIPRAFGGSSRVGAMLGTAREEPDPVFAELLPYTAWEEHHEAVIQGDEKLIRIVSSGLEEYYDLSEDPGEQNDLSAERPERVETLGDRLDAFLHGDATN